MTTLDQDPAATTTTNEDENVAEESILLLSMEPKNLYEFLDETSSGIAEWILPLVLAADLQHVHWIHPASSSSPTTTRLPNYATARTATDGPCCESAWLQFQNGRYNYHVGAWIPPEDDTHHTSTSTLISSFLDLPEHAMVKVDLGHSYYWDDHAVVPTNELHLPQQLQLTVSELEAWHDGKNSKGDNHSNTRPKNDEEDSIVITDASLPWALDICLDYFACRNPFLTDIETCNPQLSQALLQSLQHTRWFRQRFQLFEENDNDYSTHTYVTESSIFREQLIQFLRLFESDDDDRNVNLVTATRDSLVVLYESEEDGQTCLQTIVEALNGCAPEIRSELVTMAMDAIPNLAMPHHHHVMPNMDEDHNNVLSHQIQYVYTYLKRQRQERNREDPFIISIARSANDGFTPMEWVDTIQQQVLTMVHDLYCGCPRTTATFQNVKENTTFCRIRALFDYGDWEGSSFETVDS
jgi:hypothetical protein